SVVATKGSEPLKNVSLTLFRDGAVIPGAFGETDEFGKFPYTFEVPKGVFSMRIKAEIAYNGVFAKEITIAVPQVSNASASSLPILVVEDNKLSEGVHRLSMAAFLESGKMVSGKLQFSTNRSV